MPLETVAFFADTTIFRYAHLYNIRLLPNPVIGYDRDTITQIAELFCQGGIHLIYELTIEKIMVNGPLSRTIQIEDSSTFEQLYQEILGVFKEKTPKNHSFQIVCSNGKKQSGVTIKQQPSAIK